MPSRNQPEDALSDVLPFAGDIALALADDIEDAKTRIAREYTGSDLPSALERLEADIHDLLLTDFRMSRDPANRLIGAVRNDDPRLRLESLLTLAATLVALSAHDLTDLPA